VNVLNDVIAASVVANSVRVAVRMDVDVARCVGEVFGCWFFFMVWLGL